MRPNTFSTMIVILSLSVMPAVMASGDVEHKVLTEVPFSVPFHAINLVIFLGVLGYFLRNPLRDFLVKRHDEVKQALFSAQKAKEDAEALASEYRAKLASIDGQAAEIKAEAEASAKAEAQRLLENAQENIERMKVHTEKMMAQESRRVSAGLRTEVIELAFSMAQEMVKRDLAGPAQERLMKEYVDGFKLTEVN